MVKILITGATGFIGSHLVEELIEKGKKIKILVRNKKNLGYLKEIPKKKLEKVEIIQCCESKTKEF